MRFPAQEPKGRGRQFRQQLGQMLTRYAHLVGKTAEGEGSRSAFKPVVAILPGDAVEDDRRELMGRSGEWCFGDAAQDGAGREFHDVSFRLGTTPDRKVQNFVSAKAFAG